MEAQPSSGLVDGLAGRWVGGQPVHQVIQDPEGCVVSLPQGDVRELVREYRLLLAEVEEVEEIATEHDVDALAEKLYPGVAFLGSQLLVERDGAGQIESAGDQGGEPREDIVDRAVEPVGGLEKFELGVLDTLRRGRCRLGEPGPEFRLGRLEMAPQLLVITRRRQTIGDGRPGTGVRRFGDGGVGLAAPGVSGGID